MASSIAIAEVEHCGGRSQAAGAAPRSSSPRADVPSSNNSIDELVLTDVSGGSLAGTPTGANVGARRRTFTGRPVAFAGRVSTTTNPLEISNDSCSTIRAEEALGSPSSMRRRSLLQGARGATGNGGSSWDRSCCSSGDIGGGMGRTPASHDSIGASSGVHGDTRRASSGDVAQSLHHDHNSLSACIRPLYALLLAPLFRDGESFIEHSRKVALAGYCGVATAAIPGLFLFPWMIAHDSNGATTPRIVYTGVCAFLFVVFDLLFYSYVRTTKRCPELLCNTASLLIASILAIVSLTTEADVRPMVVAAVTLCSLLHSRLFPLLVCGYLIVFLVDYFHDNFPDELPELHYWSQHIDPNARHTAEKVFDVAFACLWPVVISVLTTVHIANTYVRKSEENKRAVELTVLIASRLRNFETETLGATITEYKGTLHPHLIDAFLAIEANLNLFRPYVPHFVIECAADRDRALADAGARTSKGVADEVGGALGGFGSLFVDNGGSAMGGHLMPHVTTPTEAMNGEDELSSIASTLDRTGTAAAASRVQQRCDVDGSDGVANVSMSSNKSTPTNSGRGSVLGNSGTSHSVIRGPSPANTRGAAFVSIAHLAAAPRITTAQQQSASISATAPSTISSTSAMIHLGSILPSIRGSALPAARALSSIIDIIAKLATRFKGAVHYVHGDSVLLTWNAVNRVAMHETKACSFLLELRDALDGLFPRHLIGGTATAAAGGEGGGGAHAECGSDVDTHDKSPSPPSGSHGFYWGASVWTGPTVGILCGSQQSFFTLLGQHIASHAMLQPFIRCQSGDERQHPIVVGNRRLQSGSHLYFSFCAVAMFTDLVAAGPVGGQQHQLSNYTSNGNHANTAASGNQLQQHHFVNARAGANPTATTMTTTSQQGVHTSSSRNPNANRVLSPSTAHMLAAGSTAGRHEHIVYELVGRINSGSAMTTGNSAFPSASTAEWQYEIASCDNHFEKMDTVVSLAAEGRRQEAEAVLQSVDAAVADSLPVRRVRSALRRGYNLVL